MRCSTFWSVRTPKRDVYFLDIVSASKDKDAMTATASLLLVTTERYLRETEATRLRSQEQLAGEMGLAATNCQQLISKLAKKGKGKRREKVRHSKT